MTRPLRYEDLAAVGRAAGLDVVGACSAAVFTAARTAIEERKAAGLNGSMQFTYRNPVRSTDPSATLPGARTLLVAACSYHRDPPEPPDGPGPVARVARYVWADDQARLLGGLEAMAVPLRAAGHRAVVLSDQNHLVDRAAAQRAGLGWFGKNANLLLPGRGSWYVLGSVLTDAGPDAIAGLPAEVEVVDGCGGCERCLTACPTGAIVAPGVVDARRCLSWSLQVKGPFPREHRVALGDRIYGCDDCQEVCPPNKRELRRAEPGGRGEAVPVGDPSQAWVRVLALLAATDEELLDRHGRWYFPDRDPAYLRRNALVVLGNVGDGAEPEVRAALHAALGHPHPVVRAQAVWSARRLGCDDLLVAVSEDRDPEVRAELAAPAEPLPSPTPRAS
ncbi:tRNA epoxyqueuosine(34) reductase QueG [Aquihabitans sp. G128]|uniref:tRNA epoxyqueuosine(34) reductase QueG n=1 Tax=Aquihabitans sp. G128 TaxID=2849779 RepID=UPI001C223423|nr:tRNA epoxyqueuosine(34) reductase QueG [Aquihabitans sp. G128]QXC62311.1 tRNA epoxyqueuosine(34) reductase QueG [Aquihabitans sp. G128]